MVYFRNEIVTIVDTVDSNGRNDTEEIKKKKEKKVRNINGNVLEYRTFMYVSLSDTMLDMACKDKDIT